MGINKIEFNGKVVMDLTGDTVTPETLAEGATAHDKAGDPIVGTMKQSGGGSASLGVRYGFDMNTGTLYLYGDGEFYGNGQTQHEDINSQVKHIVFFENISSVRKYAFRNYYPNLETVSFCNSVAQIGNSAFTGCKNLRTVRLPKNITEVGGLLFAGTGLEEIVIPAAVTKIDNSFSACEKLHKVEFEKNSELLTLGKYGGFDECITLEKIDLPKKVTELGNSAFSYDEALKQITLPVSLKKIGNYCFEDCTALEFVLYGGTPEQWAQITLGSGNEAITEANLYFLEYSGEDDVSGYDPDYLPSDSVPAMVDVYHTQTAGVEWFLRYYLPDDADKDANYAIGASFNSWTQGVEIGEGIKSILMETFAGAAFKEITLPESLTHIGAAAFAGCENLESISLPESLTHIGAAAFAECTALKSISIPENVTMLNEQTFAGCASLEKVYIPAGCSIKQNAALFAGCESLTDIYLGGPESYMDDYASNDLGIGWDDVNIHYNASGLPSEDGAE
jgi:hypothetical protein